MDHYSFLEALRRIDERKALRGRTTSQAVADAVTTDAAAWNERARELLLSGRHEEALSAWTHALSCKVDDLALLESIGFGLRQIDHDPAALLERIARSRSDDDTSSTNVESNDLWQAVCLSVLRQDWAAALPLLEEECEKNPYSNRCARNLVLALRHLGQEGRALCELAAADAIIGNWRAAADTFLSAPFASVASPAYLAVAIRTFRHSGDEAHALELASDAARKGLCNPAARYQWATALMDQHRAQEALDVLNGDAKNDWMSRLLAGLILPGVPESQLVVDQADARVVQFIRHLDDLQLPKDEEELKELEAALEPNFYLAYRDQPDLETTRKFGNFVSKVVTARFPEYTQPIARADLVRRRIRIGYITRHAMYHTVTRHFAGWISHADHAEFELHLFQISNVQDWMSGYLQAEVDVYHPSCTDIESLARQIRSAELDVLVHIAVGMDPLTYRLAALRLATVQCVAWGHPVSTGLPAADYYISATGFEPDNGQEHYSERLVTLPGLGASMSMMPLPEQPTTRSRLGLPEQGTLFVSPQSPFKYLPSYDDIYARIASATGNSIFVFVEDELPAWARTFRKRIETSFLRFGLEPEDQLVFLKPLPFEDFLSLLGCCDVMLDTMGWSGGQTSYDALACGLPIVTLPGQMMRGRQTYGMLRQIGVEDTIASDVDDYVRIAVRLGKDRAWRDDVTRRVRENKHLLFNDVRPVRALEAFYRWAVGNARPEDEGKFRLWPPA